MIVFRTFDARLVDRIINHVDVRASFQPGTEPLSSTAFLQDPRNIVLITTMGLYAFQWRGDNTYLGCAAQLPQARGKLAFAEAEEAKRKMFTVYGARRIEAEAPLWLPASRTFLRRIGFKAYGVNDNYELLAVEA